MTFVEMLERLRVECGASGATITDVTTVRGEHLRLKNWLQQAWLDIQGEFAGQWEWMRAESSHTIPLNGSLLSVSEWSAGTVNRWKIDSFRIATLAAPRALSTRMVYVEYDDFRDGVGLDPTAYNKPQYVTIRPSDKALMIAPAADASYTLYFEYWSEPVALEDDADEIPLNAKYHVLPVYKAMIDYGYYDAAPEVLARAREKHDDLMFRLKLEQLPTPQWGGPLA